MGTDRDPRLDEPRWPVTQFNEYLDERMAKAGIGSRNQLATKADIPPQTLSQWRKGTVRPTFEMLNKVAPALNVARVELWIKAGRITRDELIIDGLPEEVPAELHQVLDLYMRCPASKREEMRADIGRLFDSWADRIELYQLKHSGTED